MSKRLSLCFSLVCAPTFPNGWAQQEALSPSILDVYSSFTQMAQTEIEGQDFRVSVVDRKSKLLSFAIHGGNVEPVTEKISRLVSGNEHNLYLFEGTKSAPTREEVIRMNRALHVTSVNFDDPRLLEMAERSELCLSFHGYRYSGLAIEMGGGNEFYRELIGRALKEEFPQVVVNPQSTRFTGLDLRNPVNRCRLKGVQFELSTGLRFYLDSHLVELTRFVRVIRENTGGLKNKN